MIIVVNLICAKYWDLFSWLVYLSLSLALIFFFLLLFSSMTEKYTIHFSDIPSACFYRSLETIVVIREHNVI